MAPSSAALTPPFVTRILHALRRYGLFVLGLTLWGLFAGGVVSYHSTQADIARAFGDDFNRVLNPDNAATDAEDAIRRGQIRFYLLSDIPLGVTKSDYPLTKRYPCAEVGGGGCFFTGEQYQYAILFNQRILKHLHQ
jgi:hypothetical protein